MHGGPLHAWVNTRACGCFATGSRHSVQDAPAKERPGRPGPSRCHPPPGGSCCPALAPGSTHAERLTRALADATHRAQLPPSPSQSWPSPVARHLRATPTLPARFRGARGLRPCGGRLLAHSLRACTRLIPHHLAKRYLWKKMYVDAIDKISLTSRRAKEGSRRRACAAVCMQAPRRGAQAPASVHREHR